MSKLSDAFEELRKRGYLARMNFACCGNCAGYELTTIAVRSIKSGKFKKEDIKGCVFFHAQDNDSRKREGAFHVGYGPLESQEFGTIGHSAAETGKEVCEVLTQFGIATEWDGDPHQRIWVIENPKEVKVG